PTLRVGAWLTRLGESGYGSADAVAEGAGLAHQIAAQVAVDPRTQRPPRRVGVQVGAVGAEHDGDPQLVVAAGLAALQAQLDVDRRAAAQAKPRQPARRRRVETSLAAQADR